MSHRRTSFDIHGMPVIENAGDFRAHAGISSRQLSWLIVSGRRAYSIFPLAKKSGGFRLIASPSAPLKLAQRWILRNILARLHTTPSSYGFERGSKLRCHAEQHVGARAILKLDIENFFPSISVAQVTQVFRSAGYSSSGAWILARLCTCSGALPQGAPSSPKLANLVCFRMDRRLARFAERRGFVYTRYADDLVFSSDSASGLAKAHPFIAHIVHDSGFRLNRRKTRLVGPRGAKIVTGFVVAVNGVGLGRKRLRELRVQLHRTHVGSDDSSLDSIQGWLSYLSDSDPARYEILVRYIERLKAKASASPLARLRLHVAARGANG